MLAVRVAALAVAALIIISGVWNHPWINWLSGDIVTDILYLAMAFLLVIAFIAEFRQRQKRPEAGK